MGMITRPDSTAPGFVYSMFRLTVLSDFRLPAPETPAEAVTYPDVRFILGELGSQFSTSVGTPISEMRCYCPEHNGQVVMAVYRHGGQAWIQHANAGICHIAPDGRTVSVFPNADTPKMEHMLGLLLAGLASIFVLQFHGFPCLHASAVMGNNGIMAFLGPKGRGKSTMAAGLIRRGATLLTDDILALDPRGTDIHGLPSLPVMKLWGQAVEYALEIDDNLPVLVPDFEKKLFTLDDRFTFARDSGRLRAIYVLDRYDPDSAGHTDVTIRQLSQREALAVLLEHTTLHRYLLLSEMAALVPIYTRTLAQAPVRVVRFPSGFEYQDMVHERLLDDAGMAVE